MATDTVTRDLSLRITPELMKQACDEARANSAGRIEQFYRQLAAAVKRHLAAVPAEVTSFAVILVAADGGVRCVLDTNGGRFIEPITIHDDPGTGTTSLWFSPHHETLISPFGSREAAAAAADRVKAAIGQSGLAERLRIVPAESLQEKELRVYLQAGERETPKPEQFLSTQVFRAFVEPARPRER